LQDVDLGRRRTLLRIDHIGVGEVMDSQDVGVILGPGVGGHARHDEREYD
jgi:hypothetical protein